MERIIRFLIQEIGAIEGCEIIKNKVELAAAHSCTRGAVTMPTSG